MGILKVPEIALLSAVLYAFVFFPLIKQNWFEKYQMDNVDGKQLALKGQSLFQMYPTKCEINTYEKVGEDRICHDCLAQLGPTCKTCTEQKNCQTCKVGYTQVANSFEWNLCEKCSTLHGEQCTKCA